MADRLFGVSNWVLIAGVFAVCVGTIGTLTMGSVRDYFANERLKANEAAMDRTRADAEMAQDGATRVQARTNGIAGKSAQVETASHHAGRALTEEQASALAASLKEAPKGQVIVKPNSHSAEPAHYASEIAAIFRSSGFARVDDSELQAVSLPRPGLFFLVRDANNPPAHALPIVNAFHHAQIPLEVAHADWVPNDDVVVILVGGRS
jgi:hypothetical protein